MCRRLSKDFGYALLAAPPASSSPAAAVSALNDGILRDGGHKFIITGFPTTLDAAFHFEKTVAQPLFVLLDGADGPVADLYMKVCFPLLRLLIFFFFVVSPRPRCSSISSPLEFVGHLNAVTPYRQGLSEFVVAIPWSYVWRQHGPVSGDTMVLCLAIPWSYVWQLH